MARVPYQSVRSAFRRSDLERIMGVCWVPLSGSQSDFEGDPVRSITAGCAFSDPAFDQPGQARSDRRLFAEGP